MAKYEVNFSCGHTHTVELFGKDSDRQKKIAYYESCGFCSDCYKEMMEKKNAENCVEKTMKYSDYKNNYSECKTKKNSYDASAKTIVVYVEISRMIADEVNAQCSQLRTTQRRVEKVISAIENGTATFSTEGLTEELTSDMQIFAALMKKYGYEI